MTTKMKQQLISAAWVLGTAILYSIVYLNFYDDFGGSLAAFSIVPVIVGAYQRGVRCGVVISIVMILVNTLLMNAVKPSDFRWDILLVHGGIPANLAQVVIAVMVGMHHDRKQLLMKILTEKNTALVEKGKKEKSLNESVRYIESILNTAPTGIFTVDQQQRIKSWNSMAEKITGLKEEEVLNKRCLDVWECPTCKKGCGLFSDKVEKPLFGRECEIVLPDRKLLITKNLNLLHDSEGNTIGGVEIFMDITQQRKQEKTILDSERSFKSIFENSSEGLHLISLESGKFISVNKAMSDIFGYSEKEFLDIKPQDISHPDDKDKQDKAFAVLRSGMKIENIEGRRLRKDGSVFWALISAAQIKWKGQRVIYGTIRDITALKEYQQKLKEKNREILDFTNAVTHDLKKPLATMKTINTLFGNEVVCKLDEDGKEAMVLFNDSIQYMQEMLQDLLSCAKLDAGAQALDYEEIDLEELINSVFRKLKLAASSKNVTLVNNVKQRPWIIDQKGITKVFMNLVGNAINYIGINNPDPKITIDYKKGKNDDLMIIVKDNGMGIPEGAQADIFQKFKRGDNVSGISGTGLGLSIVKGVVEAHGGRIWFESKEGEGTTFYFTLSNQKW